MIGNDIVDLQEATQRSDWSRPRYLDKIYTDREQVIIRSETNKHIAVWLLWTMKESVYKILARKHQYQKYNPKQIECNISINSEADQLDGLVIYQGITYYSKSFISKSIHTIASTTKAKLGRISHQIIANENKKTQSANIRQSMLNHIADRNNLTVDNSQFSHDSYGAPILTLGDRMVTDLSFSHHGRFSGSACIF